MDSLLKGLEIIQSRLDTYHERFTDENTVFNKGIHHNAKRLIKFLKNTKCLSRKPKLTKADLSPIKTCKGQKRKRAKPHKSNPTNPSKQKKLSHYMQVIADLSLVIHIENTNDNINDINNDATMITPLLMSIRTLHDQQMLNIFDPHLGPYLSFGTSVASN